MLYRKLGSTGLTVSVVGIGTWQFGGEWGKKFKRKDVRKILDAGRELGINLIDTAECYGDHTSEKLIGKAIRKNRDRWIVATKFGHTFNSFLNRTPDYSAASMVKQLEKSLRALRTDYIDLYQVHGVSEETAADDELWQALEKQKELGKIRTIGVSIGHDAFPLQRERVQAVQVHYNRLDRGAEEAVLSKCLQKNLGVLARVPLASGLLSGKYQPGERWQKGDVRNRIDDEDIDRNLKQVEQIKREEMPPETNLATWALRWCLRNSAVTCVIPGCKSVEQVRANAEAANGNIEQESHPQAAHG